VTAGELELEIAPGRLERLAPAGPSFWGSVHRGKEPTVYYRLVPVAQVPLDGRSEVRRWVGGSPRPGVAPIADAQQVATGGWFAIRYDLSAAHTLAELPPQTSLSARLGFAVRVLHAFPRWVEALGDGLLPMPADIAVTAAGSPYLLPMPYRWPPDPPAALEEPARGWHLAPEIVRGRPSDTPEAADRYALGATLMRLFARPELDDPAELLLRAATATAFGRRHLRSLLPGWFEGLPAAERLRTGVGRLLQTEPAARCWDELGRLAEELAALRPWTVPAEAIRRLEVEGRRDQAWVLLLEALDDDSGYELLLAGGGLAGRDPRRHEAAVRLFEQAIERQPERPEAYQMQIELLATEAGTGSDATGDLLVRDFQWLPAYRQDALEVRVAQRLLGLGRSRRAAEFIYPRLFRNDDYLWWKLELNLCYAEALLGLPQREGEARRQLDRVERGLDTVQEHRTEPVSTIRRARAWAAQLRGRLRDRRGGPP
jgi:tetratricopeptide (TPR) repeat protein